VGEYEYLTVIELTDETVLQSEEYLQARATPSDATQKLAPHYTLARSVYKQIYPSSGPCEDYGGIKQEAFEADDSWVAPLTGGI
jgi:hypothetical protein